MGTTRYAVPPAPVFQAKMYRYQTSTESQKTRGSGVMALLGVAGALLFAPVSEAGWRDWVDDILQAPPTEVGSTLSESEIVAGLREALSRASSLAISQLGSRDGYWANQRVRLPLPDTVSKVAPFLDRIGQGQRVEVFHESMNRAAEQAVPEGLQVLQQTVSGMTFDDARQILNGPQDAATQFFERSSRNTLQQRFEPIVDNSLGQVGVTSQYQQIMAQATPVLAMVGRQPETLQGFTTRKSLDGLFTVLADEEGRIRKNPAARTSELLKKVFGARQ